MVHAGVLEIAARLLSNLAVKSQDGRLAALEEAETISVALGLLINIAESCPKKMHQLVDAELPCHSHFVPLLCNFIEASLCSPWCGVRIVTRP